MVPAFREKQVWKRGWNRWEETERVMERDDILSAREINRYVMVSFWSQEKMEVQRPLFPATTNGILESCPPRAKLDLIWCAFSYRPK